MKISVTNLNPCLYVVFVCMQSEVEEARAMAQEVSSAQEGKASAEEELKSVQASLEGKAKQLKESEQALKQAKVHPKLSGLCIPARLIF